MRERDQKMRFNSAEMGLFKSLFENNEEALFLLKRVMLQAELSEADKQNIREMMTEPVLALMKKIIVPDFDPDAPMGQSASLMLHVSTDIKGKNPDEAWPHIKAKELELAYLTQQLGILKDPEAKPEVLLRDYENISGPKTQREAIYINVLVWNWIVGWVEGCMSAINSLAHQKVETVEERNARIAKESSK